MSLEQLRTSEELPPLQQLLWGLMLIREFWGDLHLELGGCHGPACTLSTTRSIRDKPIRYFQLNCNNLHLQHDTTVLPK